MWGCVILLRLKCTSHIVNTPPLPSPGYVIENQTLLSIRRAAKGKCVCFPLAQCFPSVFHFLPRASCTAAINPLLVVLYPLFFSFFFFFYRKLSWLSGCRLTTTQCWMETYVAGPTEGEMDSGDWWMARLHLYHQRRRRHWQARDLQEGRYTLWSIGWYRCSAHSSWEV